MTKRNLIRFIIIFNLLRNKQTSNLSFLTSRNSLVKSLSKFSILSNSSLLNAIKIRKIAKENSGSWLPTVGATIAFVGCDGAGKSPIVKDINKWLSWKLSVKQFYMGKPKTNNNIVRIIHIISKILKKLRFKVIANEILNYRWVIVAKERYNIYLRSLKFKKQGNIVLFDRYSLKEFWDMKLPMDGPRLADNKYFGKKEKEYYQKIQKPDYLFILKVTEQQSIARKPEHKSLANIEMLKMKTEAIDNFIINNKAKNVFIINTTKPQDKVVLEIKNKIWSLI